MTRQEHEALAAKALAWLSRQWISDKELEAFLIATLDESTGLVFGYEDSAGVAVPNGADVSLGTVTAPVAEEAPSSVPPSPPPAPSPAAGDGRDCIRCGWELCADEPGPACLVEENCRRRVTYGGAGPMDRREP